jgi:hypothetical protein
MKKSVTFSPASLPVPYPRIVSLLHGEISQLSGN